jgi:hypothetical protein
MKLYMVLIFSFLVSFAISAESEQQIFIQMTQQEDIYSEIFNYRLRLTNLRNKSNNRDVEELPIWNNSVMGGIFCRGIYADPVNYDWRWGHNGASSPGVSIEDLEIVLTSKNINPWDIVYIDFLTTDVFEYQKYIRGKNVSIKEPLMVNFYELENDIILAHSDSPQFGSSNGEIRLFIPFATDKNKKVLPFMINVGGDLANVPKSIQSSPNYELKMDLNPDSPEFQKSQPGICIVFYPISANTPHDVTPDSSEFTLVGASMSSFRNKDILEYNQQSGRSLPLADWGYEGYFYAYKDDCLEFLAPDINEDCICRSNRDRILAYTATEVLMMDCTGPKKDSRPLTRDTEFEPLICADYIFRINGEIVNFLNPGPGGYAGKDIGYAAYYAVKNRNFSEVQIMNWATNEKFTLTMEPR